MRLIRRALDWTSRSPFVVDAVLAGMAWLAFLVLGGSADGWTLFLVTAQVLPLAWRRTEPFAAAMVIAAACLLQVITLDLPLISNVSALAIVYATAAYGQERWQSLAVGVAGLCGSVLGVGDWMLVREMRYQPDGVSVLVTLLPTLLFMWMSVAVAWVLGDVVRRRRAVVARLREQNEALARDQAQRAALAAQGERATIAREMHDIVAHSLSVVVVQADGGAYAARTALDRGTGGDVVALERAAQTLETLATTAREALTDTRRLVGVLRDRGSAAEFEPTQGLNNLEGLVQRVRDSGVPVALAVRGAVDRLPREVDLAAYRVVQESLTNVLKHAGPDASVTVDVLRTPAVLLVRVTDDGRGAAVPDGQGNGIIGMRERVEFLGGTLHAGPRAGGGFEVSASVPVVDADPVPVTESAPEGARSD
ncbi:histidine kinase [Ornithinimicrobium sp. F0845]|uniref:sensor histidine kinase n=1 Tax=Ornithinimicrobium sp. F0845 TaxID=2926412 RepID=UPI001FF2CF9E|nr:histidine kinase [Ornithinimicrobium sp. F0845]MCK0112829.1 histidine kinase [Ornithinimicrobium sp. F0845]